MSLEARLRQVVADVLGVPLDGVTDAASPDTIETWDSVRHIEIVLAVEGEFGVQFDPDEIPALASVGRIRERLERDGIA